MVTVSIKIQKTKKLWTGGLIQCKHTSLVGMINSYHDLFNLHTYRQ